MVCKAANPHSAACASARGRVRSRPRHSQRFSPHSSSANGIHAAQQLAERLGLTNITFLHTDLETLPPMEFDTVFSSRTVQENYDPLLENARFLPLTHQGRICAQVFQRYTSLLCQFVKPGGTFVTVERMERDRVFLGYCLALHSQGLDLVPESHQELHCPRS